MSNRKFDIIEKLKEEGFTEDELLDMFIYWSDVRLVEECVEDFLNDRDLEIDYELNIKGK